MACAAAKLANGLWCSRVSAPGAKRAAKAGRPARNNLAAAQRWAWPARRRPSICELCCAGRALASWRPGAKPQATKAGAR